MIANPDDENRIALSLENLLKKNVNKTPRKITSSNMDGNDNRILKE
jgi:hypothetical protein